MNLINQPLVSRVRRNHGLEHATIHVLGERGRLKAVAGYATPSGFFVVGNLEAGDIAAAAGEALRRLQAGQKHLAVHPGCGTNYATSGMLAGTLALFSVWLAGGRRQSKIDQLSNATVAATVGVLFGQALGKWIQANVTTSSDAQGMAIRRVTRILEAPARVHFVETGF